MQHICECECHSKHDLYAHDNHYSIKACFGFSEGRKGVWKALHVEMTKEGEGEEKKYRNGPRSDESILSKGKNYVAFGKDVGLQKPERKEERYICPPTLAQCK